MAICPTCENIFDQKNPGHKYCAVSCRPKYSDENKYGTKLSPGTTGAISEMIACADLLERGYEVFRAVSPTCSCDLIAMKNGKTIRVEVRTSYVSTATGMLQIPLQPRDLERSDVAAIITKQHEIFYIPEGAIE